MLPSTAMLYGPGMRDTGEALPAAMQHRRSKHHFDEQVHGGEIVEEGKQNGLGTMKIGRTEVVRVVRNSSM